MDTSILLLAPIQDEFTSMGYLMGAIIAFLVFGYLVYSLIKPEKF